MTDDRIRELALRAGLANSDGCEIILREALAEQREEDARACLKAAQDYDDGFADTVARSCAAAIRGKHVAE